MDMNSLKVLQDIDYASMEPDKMVDVSEIKIDTNKDIFTRLDKFINEVTNPYILKCGKTVVEVEFSDTNKTIDCQIESYLKSLKTG